MVLFLLITRSGLKLYKFINTGKSVVLISKLSTLLEFMFKLYFDSDLVSFNVVEISENNSSLLLQFNWKKNR